jgi:hypothetical protein
MKTVSLGGGEIANATLVSYDQKVEKIASTQTDYVDEYEGFGSLTEMIKNQDKIASKEVEDKQKKDLITQAKAKLTKALAKPVENKEADKKAAELAE